MKLGQSIQEVAYDADSDMFAKCTMVLYEPLQDFYGDLEFTEYYNSRGELLSEEYDRQIDLSKGLIIKGSINVKETRRIIPDYTFAIGDEAAFEREYRKYRSVCYVEHQMQIRYKIPVMVPFSFQDKKEAI
jgi:hypothetical protein